MNINGYILSFDRRKILCQFIHYFQLLQKVMTFGYYQIFEVISYEVLFENEAVKIVKKKVILEEILSANLTQRLKYFFIQHLIFQAKYFAVKEKD